MTAKQLAEQVIALPAKERAWLTEVLLRSLEGDEASAEEHERLWDDVAEQRLTEINAGSTKLIAADEVIARLRKAI